MPELAYLNGQIKPLDQTCVPVEDRGYQFGDAVYEFIASYDGRLFALEEHMQRLQNSMQGLDFPQLSLNQVRSAILDTFQQASIARAGVYVQISRGVAPRNHGFPVAGQPQIVITVRHVPKVPANVRRNGARVITVTDIRWGRCDIKTVQLLPNVLAKQRAVDSGAHDAIFVSAEGVVRECTTSNVFIVKNGSLQTHPLTHNILAGITRSVTIALCREQSLPITEDFFKKQELLDADEIFLTGTTTEILPVTRIDDHRVGQGQPGPIALKLFKLLRRRAETESLCAVHSCHKGN